MEHGGNVWAGPSPKAWLDFSSNLRPDGIPDWVREILLSAIPFSRYYPDPLMRAARDGLAQYAQVSPDCILPTAGGTSAIDLVMRLFSGRSLFLPPHSFSEYETRALTNGLIVRSPDSMEIKDGLLSYIPGNLAPGDLMLLCNPHNPTGDVIDRDTVLQLHKHLSHLDTRLIVDEAFIDFCPENSVRSEVSDSLIVVGSLTKTLCIPGIRLGYICAAPSMIEALSKLQLTWEVSIPAQFIAMHAGDHLAQIEADRQKNDLRREQLVKLLRPFCEIRPSHANFLLCDFHRDTTDLKAKLKAKQILVRSCTSFGLSTAMLRITVRTEAENERLAMAIADCLCQ